MRSRIFFLFFTSTLITGCFINNESKSESKSELKTDSIIEKTYSFSNDLKNDLKKLNLFGKVKSVKEYSFSAELINGKIAKGNRKREYLNAYDNITIFNESGNTLEKYNYTSDSTIYDSQICKYDKKNNLIEENYHNIYENTKIKYVYGYNEKNQLISRKTYNENNKLTNTLKYEYENNNRVIKCLSYDSNGNYTSTNISYYDENGNEVEAINKNYIEFTSKYVYDKSGKQIEYKNIGSDGRLSFKQSYKYDINGNLIEERDYIFDESLNKLKSFKYEFDGSGNWINCILSINNKPMFILVREIEYY